MLKTFFLHSLYIRKSKNLLFLNDETIRNYTHSLCSRKFVSDPYISILSSLLSSWLSVIIMGYQEHQQLNWVNLIWYYYFFKCWARTHTNTHAHAHRCFTIALKNAWLVDRSFSQTIYHYIILSSWFFLIFFSKI